MKTQESSSHCNILTGLQFVIHFSLFCQAIEREPLNNHFWPFFFSNEQKNRPFTQSCDSNYFLLFGYFFSFIFSLCLGCKRAAYCTLIFFLLDLCPRKWSIYLFTLWNALLVSLPESLAIMNRRVKKMRHSIYKGKRDKWNTCTNAEDECDMA